MIDNKLHTILPIYRKLSDQHHRKPGMIGELGDVVTAPLWCPSKRLLPFQYRQPSTWRTVSSILLIVWTETGGEEILTDIPAGDLRHDTADGYTYVTYLGAVDLTTEMECGTYYLRIYDGASTFYSEVFTVVDSISTGGYTLGVNDDDDLVINDSDDSLLI